NQLSGSIPSELGKLISLVDLRFFENKFTSSISPKLDNLTHLQIFDIAINNLTGHLPQSICLSGSLVRLIAPNNNLTGDITKSLRNCSYLHRVRLEQNQFTGDISEVFGVLPNLLYIDLSFNNFYGELSQKWGQCLNLTSLKFSNNKISGNIPPELGGATQLRVLDLYSNHLVGEIPKNLGNLGFLFALSLSDNKLSGNIPTEIEILNLSNNRLSGSIPSSFNGASSLTYVDISHNHLEGPLPNCKGFQDAPFDAYRNNDVPILGIILLVAVGAFLFLRKRVGIIENEPIRENNEDLIAIWSYDGKMVYENIIEATEDFSATHCIGVGGYGTGGNLEKIGNEKEALNFEWTKRVNVIKELAYTMEVNEKLDVYSFGIFTLEVLIGKHRGDLISSLSSSSRLSSSSSSSLPTAYSILLTKFLDTCLPSLGTHVEKEVVLAAKIALACLHTDPQCRPTMQQVSVALSKQRPPLQKSFHSISLGQLYDVNCSTS
ncbi:MDIS1-interacting receptor like kinase 2, partial [Camellia lanceoleosa]